MSDKIVLGINDSHPSSACLLKNGKILACISEERLTRIKNDHNFPEASIKKMMADNNINPEDVNLVAFSSKGIVPIDLNKLASKTYDTRKSVILFSNSMKYFPTTFNENVSCRITTKSRQLYKKLLVIPQYKKILQDLQIKAQTLFYDHQTVHAATAYYFKGIPKNDVLIFTCDGEGDGLCATVSIGHKGRIERVVSIPFIHSIAKIYNEVTWYLGLKPWDHEYKVMGMAPYSSKKYAEKTCAVFDKTVSIDSRDRRKFRNTSRRWAHSYGSYLKKNLYKHRFDSIAFAVQHMVENIATKWISNNIEHYGISDIMLSGGFFMNVKANQKILEMNNVNSIFVVPSAGDESTAIGAALLAYANLCKADGVNAKFSGITDIYFGPSYDNVIGDFVRTIDKKKFRVSYYKDINGHVGEMLSKGKIVARLNGGMEFGARALGNRSILADPRDLGVIKEINSQIKHRDFWMPFAATILRESSGSLLDMPNKEVDDQYMIVSSNTTESGRNDLKAAIHQSDSTCRPQVIDKTWNTGYHRLVRSFEKETGVGGILNTSFNLHGEPIVCTPQDALSTLERSGLKYLALGNFLIEKV